MQRLTKYRVATWDNLYFTDRFIYFIIFTDWLYITVLLQWEQFTPTLSIKVITLFTYYYIIHVKTSAYNALNLHVRQSCKHTYMIICYTRYAVKPLYNGYLGTSQFWCNLLLYRGSSSFRDTIYWHGPVAIKELVLYTEIKFIMFLIGVSFKERCPLYSNTMIL